MLASRKAPGKRTTAVGWTIALAALAAVAAATLLPGDPAMLQPTSVLCLVCGDAGLVDVWRNVVLFVPLGVGLGIAGIRARRAALVGLLTSLTIEALQHTALAGRDASLSDLATNTIGAALGCMLARTWPVWARPSPTHARRLAIGGAAAWIGLLAVAAAGLQWAIPAPPFRIGGVPPGSGAMRPFEGRIVAARLDGRDVLAEAPPHTDRILEPADAVPLAISALVEPSYPPGKLRPIVSAFADGWSEALVLGQQSRVLVLRVRTRSADVRLLSPTFVLADAFPEGAERVAVSAEAGGTAVVLESRTARGLRRVRFGRSIALGWRIFQPWSGAVERVAPALALLWLGIPTLVLGYWATAATVPTRGGVTAGAAGLLALIALPALVSAAARLAPLGPAEWIALIGSAGAGLAGWLAAQRAPDS